MAELELSEFKADLRHRIRHFLWDERNRKGARANAVRRIIDRGWRSCLFGGVVRDIVVKSPWVKTRDIDIVVADVTTEDLRIAFEDVFVRQNRFGGLMLNIDGWHFDVWPLAATWGFRFFPLFANTFAVLPKTTFFSVEAIAVELPTTSGVPRTIFHDGFVESIRSRVISLNLPENPYPELCIIRAFTLAQKLDFKLGADLVRHLSTWARQIPCAQIEKAMVHHYGRRLYTRDQIQTMVRQLHNHADSDSDTPMSVDQQRQLKFEFPNIEPFENLIADAADFGTDAAVS